MASIKTVAPDGGGRGAETRQRVTDAAERLLRRAGADFSMRDLADDAGVSFATPFNQFGNKAGVLHALSARRVETMMARLEASVAPAGALDRVLRATDLAVAVMLEEPVVNRAVMSGIGTAGPSPGRALARSTAFWAMALGAGVGLDAARRDEALPRLPAALAVAFRGALSFWTAGELSDAALGATAREVAAALVCVYAPDR